MYVMDQLAVQAHYHYIHIAIDTINYIVCHLYDKQLNLVKWLTEYVPVVHIAVRMK